eukprot:scaffold1221_cov207-Amphora_coffeaeformis.AAC.50
MSPEQLSSLHIMDDSLTYNNEEKELFNLLGSSSSSSRSSRASTTKTNNTTGTKRPNLDKKVVCFVGWRVI